MNEADGIAAWIAAVEQRLAVALLRGDDHARRLARDEIARLKNQLRPPQQRTAGQSMCTAVAQAAAH